MLRRTAALLLAVASLGIAACGNDANQGDTKETADSEAIYVDLNGLKYQVQLSRQLNPRDAEDAGYFQNIDPADSMLAEGEIWFGVFIRVENESGEPIPSAREFEIEDTQGNVYEPVKTKNIFAYQPETVRAKGYLPNPERLQAYAGTQGSLLLFKIPVSSLDNRPLELTIKNPSDTRKAARIDLDV